MLLRSHETPNREHIREVSRAGCEDIRPMQREESVRSLMGQCGSIPTDTGGRDPIKPHVTKQPRSLSNSPHSSHPLTLLTLLTLHPHPSSVLVLFFTSPTQQRPSNNKRHGVPTQRLAAQPSQWQHHTAQRRLNTPPTRTQPPRRRQLGRAKIRRYQCRQICGGHCRRYHTVSVVLVPCIDRRWMSVDEARTREDESEFAFRRGVRQTRCVLNTVGQA